MSEELDFEMPMALCSNYQASMNEIEELKEKIAELEEQNAELKKQNMDLKKQNDELSVNLLVYLTMVEIQPPWCSSENQGFCFSSQFL